MPDFCVVYIIFKNKSIEESFIFLLYTMFRVNKFQECNYQKDDIKAFITVTDTLILTGD